MYMGREMLKRRWHSGGRAGTWVAAWLALVPLSTAQSDEAEVRSFSLPDTRAAQGLVAAVQDHLAAERMQEASVMLQELLEEHSKALLSGRVSLENGLRSQQPVHEGVGPWATAKLFSLPEGPKESYRRRYEEMAAAQLERARLTTDREALAGVGARWPLTQAAERAWWILGDLSLERGLVDEARHAWRRGAAWALEDYELSLSTPEDWRALPGQLGERPDAAAISARVELAASSLESTPSFDAALSRPLHGELRIPGEGELRACPAPGVASAWAEPFELAQGHPFTSSYNNFFAARSEHRVVISTSMRAACVNAFSGELLWDSGEAPGWEGLSKAERNEFHKAIDHQGAVIAPALSDRVAVCALEVPFAVYENQDFNHIPILRRIPDRRLFAFDLESGEELWSHMPPKNWDGESGTFPESSRVAGPAVIAGGRVLVPAYRLEGRIAYHVACYDLETGALIWNTQVISGQRELNMFNRHQTEFCAPPLRVEGDRVLALTQLGSVACLDLFGGELLWETLYDQTAIPQRGRFTTRRRESTWSNTAPSVGDDVVVCTPIDSRDIFGLDLKTGAMLWSLGLRDIESITGTPKVDLSHLVGCDRATVFLSGQGVVAIEAPMGLQSGAPTRVRWVAKDESMDNASRTSRAVLMEDRVVWPTHAGRVDVDRHQGFRLANPTRWSAGKPGNVLVCNDALFTLDNFELNGYFEWERLLEAARESLAESPDDPGRALALADLLREQARAELAEERVSACRSLLSEAESLLRARIDSVPRARGRLHQVLSMRARALEQLADTTGALAAWEESSQFAPDAYALLESLVEVQRLQVGAPERVETLKKISRECAGLFVACESDDERVSGLAPLPSFEPTPEDVWKLEASRWALWAQVDHYQERGDSAAQLAALYELLDGGTLEELPAGDSREVALRLLDELLERPGARSLLEPYEALAAGLLEEVEELDAASIQAVLSRYPRTEAATRASDELLMLTISSGDVPTAASLVLDLLPESFSLGAGDPLHSSRVVALALALRESGNEAYLRGALRRLSEARSSDSSFLPTAYSVDLDQLTEELLSKTPPETTRASSFLPTARSRGDLGTRAGLDVEILGDIPPALDGPEDPARVLLVGTREVESATGNGELTAYSADDLDQPLWKHKLRSEFVSIGWREEMRLFGPGYVAVASGRGIECVGRSDGMPRWQWRPDEGEVYALDSVEGLVLATCRLATRTFRVQALDEARGEPLWSFEYDSRSYHRTAVCGDSWLVLLPTGRLRDAVILDAFTGRVAYTLDLGEPLSSRIAQGAWISEGKLVIPHLTARRDATSAQLGVVDLASGGPVWNITVALPDGGESYLDACLRQGERTWLLVRPRGGDETRAAELFELHLGVGGAARVHGLSLGRNEVLLGVESGRTLLIDSSQVFVRSEEQGGAVHRLRTHDLSTGARLWAWSLGSNRELYNRRWPEPAISSEAVAIVFTEKGPRMRTNLLFLNPLTGARMGGVTLPDALGWSDQIELEGLGDSLFVSGVQMMQVLR